MNIIIRGSKLEDFTDVMLLFKQLWPGKELNANELMTVFSRGIQADSDEYLCVELNGKVIGFCSFAIVNNFWQEGHIAYVYAMVIDESFRGQGIGTELLKRAFDKAKLRGCKKIELDSGFPREKAHRFYEKIGFEKRAYLFSKDL
ncbi:MAG: GNAT family N-acetyltransferase [Bacilli bacterium]|nr:GNAT family N-acetyltransferase [Bacilli bacterium]HPR92972.1 GNAT family N-acetyltransferase [Syntrophomonadaceae bacterium]